MSYYAGIDFGATRLRAAVATETGEIIGKHPQSTPDTSNVGTIFEAIQQSIQSACADAGIELTAITAAGIGSIGPLDFSKGEIVQSPNLPASTGRIPLTTPLKEFLNVDDVYLLNDSTAGLIGERFYLRQQRERVPDDMVYLTISTGISVGVTMQGVVLHENAGEVGHWVIDPDRTMACGCGKEGHWEAYCSGNNIPNYARFLYEENDVETDLSIYDHQLDASEVFSNAQRDELAALTVKRAAEWNVIGTTNIIHAFDPDELSIGGGLAFNNPELTIDSIREGIQDEIIVDPPKIRRAASADVVVRGAIAVAINHGISDIYPPEMVSPVDESVNDC